MDNEPIVYTFEEFINLPGGYGLDHQEDGKRWGRWTLEKDRLVLVYRPEPDLPVTDEIDLERCQTPKDVVYWLAMNDRRSGSATEDVGNLVHALNDCLNLNELAHQDGEPCG